MFRSFYRNAAQSVKDSAKSIAKDAENVAKSAKNVLKKDFDKACGAATAASDKIDEKVRGTDKERFHAAQEAARRAENAGTNNVLFAVSMQRVANIIF